MDSICKHIKQSSDLRLHTKQKITKENTTQKIIFNII